MNSKANQQISHCRRRLRERFGIVLTQWLYDQIIGKIRSGEAALFMRQSCRVTIWDISLDLRPEEFPGCIKHETMNVRIVYDSQRHTLVSALTLDMDCGTCTY